MIIGKRALIRLPSGVAQGEVVEVAGRVLGRTNPPGALPRVQIDPGWAKVELDDGTVVLVHQDNIIEMLDS